MNKILLTIVISVVLSACANNKSIYHWGQYESLLYKSYHVPGEGTPDIQIVQLEQDIEKAKSLGKKTPPGLYAHLGFMYASVGNSSLAMEALEMEKSLFPESTVLIDGMINRSLKNAEGNK